MKAEFTLVQAPAMMRFQKRTESRKRMANDDAEQDGKTVALDMMAQGDIDQMRNYLQRGRSFADLDDEALASRWVSDMRVWSKSVAHRPRDLDDAGAEYKLRQQEPPYHLVEAEVEAVVAAVSAAFEAMTEEEKEKANEQIMADFKANRKSRN